MRTKRDGTVLVVVQLTLKPERDHELIKTLKHAPDRKLAEVVRELMRKGLETREEKTG